MKSFFQILTVVVLVGSYVFAGNFFGVVADNASAATLNEGDIIRGLDGIKVYIINANGYKRHIFSPEVFGMYGHLKWSNIKEVNQSVLDSYKSSDVYRVEGDPKVYQTTEDGTKRWFNMTGEKFIASGYDFRQIFLINAREGGYYRLGQEIVYRVSALGGVPVVADQDINLQGGLTTQDYASAISGVWEKTGLSKEEIEKIAKDKDSRPLSVEEIGKKSEIIGLTGEYLESLKIWQNFEIRVVNELKKMPVASQNSTVHKKMIAWYQYHINYAMGIEKSVSRNETKTINEEYFKNSDAYLPDLQGRLTELADASDDRFLAWKFLAKSTKAIFFRDYGGTITSIGVCDSGVVINIFGLDGGRFGLRYSTWAMNPYLYNVIAPGIETLGKSFPYQFICTVSGVPVSAAPYTIWFFGTSLIP